MAEFSFTPAQQRAIEVRDSAVLVSAGAGSGKTRVLTERLMARLTDPEYPVDIDRFAVITFTRAAAAELKGRISQELTKRLEQNPEDTRLRRQSALLRNANIGTIHSFCTQILRENCHLLGLSPDFRILEGERAEELQQKIMDRLLDDLYEDSRDIPHFCELVDTVGQGRNDSTLVDTALSCWRDMQSHARPDLWARKQMEALKQEAADVGKTPWGRELLESALARCAYWCGEVEKIRAVMDLQEDIQKKYGSRMAQIAENGDRLRQTLAVGWDAAAEAQRQIVWPDFRGCFVKNPEDPAAYAWVKTHKDTCLKALKDLGGLFTADSAALLEDQKKTAPVLVALLQLVLAFDQRFAAAKRQAGVLDFSDLEHFTARLLTEEDGTPTALARQVSRRYAEIMVDEYQDVSRVQDAIFRAVSVDGNNRFLVGDIKQSIYRFRLADPGIFREKLEQFMPDALAAPGTPRKIMLRENFRSRREVLEGANAIFRTCMSQTLGDVDYDSSQQLICGATGYTGRGELPCLYLLEARKGSETDEEETPDTARQEADFVAAQIRRLVDSGTQVQDGKDGQRLLKYGDIAVLMRSPNKKLKTYAAAFEAAGVPLTVGRSGEFFDALEISVLQSLLALVDNPHRDVQLLSAMSWPGFDFPPDRLARMRYEADQGDLYGALCARAEADVSAAEFLNLLKGLRRQAPDMTVSRLVWHIVNELDMMALCSAMPCGENRRNNLLQFVELAGEYESGGQHGLHGFLRFLERRREKDDSDTAAGGGQAVQILSIHKSKGLEFPVVFLCSTAKKFNRQDENAAVVIHPELGLGAAVVDRTRKIRYPSLAKTAIKERMRRESLSEEMRLLYVAVTRAKERLYITGTMSKAEEKLEKKKAEIYEGLSPEQLAGAGCMQDWLVWAALKDGGKHLQLQIVAGSDDASEKAEKTISPSDVRYDRAGEGALTKPEEEQKEVLRLQNAGQDYDADGLAQQLRKNLETRYPYPDAVELPSKITATELKDAWDDAEEENGARLLQPAERLFRLPVFPEEKPDGDPAERGESGKLSAAERGTALHRVMQNIRPERCTDRNAIRQEIRRVEKEQQLTALQAASVNVRAVEQFFRSAIGQRLQQAQRVEREFRFSLLCDAGQMLGRGAGEKILLQGVVDCCILEPDGILLLDYKTDYIEKDNETMLQEKVLYYTPQLLSYAMALQRIFQLPVKEKILYFLSPGREVHV